MVEPENLKVAVAKFVAVAVAEDVFVDDDDAWRPVESGAIKGGWVMGKWR